MADDSKKTWLRGAPAAGVMGLRSAQLAIVAVAVMCVILVWRLTDDAPGLDAPFHSISEEGYLTADLWNDGQAEVAFYQVTRTQDQYGRARDQSFLAGTYLVKHDFDRAAGSKATASSTESVPAFKYALFYEFESRSYEYKRSWVANLRQSDLRPLKASFASFDWCANQYREFSFGDGGQVDHLYRSDDYGNSSDVWSPPVDTYPPSALPVLLRAVDLTAGSVTFRVLTKTGETVLATASLDGSETDAERIRVTYSGPVESLIGEKTGDAEVWWRATGGDRRLLAMEASDGRYRMELVELIRSPYWEEDVYERLQRVTERP